MLPLNSLLHDDNPYKSHDLERKHKLMKPFHNKLPDLHNKMNEKLLARQSLPTNVSIFSTFHLSIAKILTRKKNIGKL